MELAGTIVAILFGTFFAVMIVSGIVMQALQTRDRKRRGVCTVCEDTGDPGEDQGGYVFTYCHKCHKLNPAAVGVVHGRGW